VVDPAALLLTDLGLLLVALLDGLVAAGGLVLDPLAVLHLLPALLALRRAGKH